MADRYAAIDPAAVLAALGQPDARVVGPVTGGADTALWRVESGGTSFALRVFRPEQAQACRREIAAMGAAAAAGLPVPCIEAAGTWQNRPALLLGWMPGRTLAAELLARPWRIWPLARAFGRTQARIHRVDAPDGLPSTDGTPGTALLHLDYHPLNVLTDGREITAVLDWANARAGDPRADVARTETILLLHPTDGGPRLVMTLFRRLLAAGWRRGYADEAGPIADMAHFRAWAGDFMLRDLAGRVPPERLAGVRDWTETWRRRGGG